VETDRLDRWIPRLMVAVILGIAIFAFTQSYTHIFDLGQSHHQTGASLRMLPLSVDLLMVGAGLVMLHLKRKNMAHPLPRVTLWGSATVTLAANVASGIIWGWESAVISAWAPIALFVAVELGMLLVRTAKVPKPSTGLEAYPLASYPDDRLWPVSTPLRQPEPAPSSEVETATIEAVNSPGEVAQGWGQLGGHQAAGPELSGIGLSNRRK
jgi:Protein of unknown function (DUF2637)